MSDGSYSFCWRIPHPPTEVYAGGKETPPPNAKDIRGGGAKQGGEMTVVVASDPSSLLQDLRIRRKRGEEGGTTFFGTSVLFPSVAVVQAGEIDGNNNQKLFLS